MKTIIRKGKLKHFLHICSNCGCEFWYDEKDIEKETAYHGVEITKTWITCPMCGQSGANTQDNIIDKEKSQDDSQPLTPEWIKENVDTESKEIELHFSDLLIIETEHATTKVIISYQGEFYWTLFYTGNNGWYVTLDDTPDTDRWMPSVKTIADFKRLFRVATGIELPLKRQTKHE